uniref:hypothetical protein n=1 Tax=Yersinia pestis TaxID=632 RepID=UPI001ED9A3C3
IAVGLGVASGLAVLVYLNHPCLPESLLPESLTRGSDSGYARLSPGYKLNNLAERLRKSRITRF